MHKHTSRDAQIDEIKDGFRLTIPAGGVGRYHLAQYDDYHGHARKDFNHRSALSLSLLARASAASIPGTWGFGLWNDPFGWSLGFGGNTLRMPALPNSVWFFQASPENYLSFNEAPGNGFLAQVFRSPPLPLARLARVGLTLPFSRVKARRLLGEIIEARAVRLSTAVTEWHAYRFEWSPRRCTFWVDDALVLGTSLSPQPPLGLVVWIDNQYAAFRPSGKIGYGVLQNPGSAWLEIKDLKLQGDPK